MSATEILNEAASERELTVTRDYDAPARLLFEAYTAPEHLMKWFGPRGYPLTLCEVDFREGGRFRFAMTGPDGVQGTPFGGVYRKIVPDREIVYDNAFELPGAGKMIVTITFAEHQGRTRLTVHTLFETVAMKDLHVGWGYAGGVGAGLDQLGDWVAGRVRLANQQS